MTEDKRTDWVALRKRLEMALRPSPERERGAELERIERRTRALAAPIEPAVEGEDDLDLIVFRLGKETYGIESRYVREIVRLTDVTIIPGVAEYVRGVMNQRGEVLLLVDLRGLFGIPIQKSIDGAKVVVCGRESIELGILADEADELRRVPGGSSMKAEMVTTSISPDLVRGVTADAVLVLDAMSLLRDPRLYIQQKQGGL